jgi:hypothetical protein
VNDTLIRIASSAFSCAAVACLAACGPAPTGTLGPAPGSSAKAHTSALAHPTLTTAMPGPQMPAPATSATPSPAPPHAITLQAWFIRAGRLFETQRTVPATRGIGKAAVNAVLAGTNTAESAAGLVSAIPAGTNLLGLKIAGAVATIDLSSSFASQASSSAVSLRLGQLVYTLTQFGTVRSVHWRISGQDVTTIGGVPVSGRQTRPAYSGDLPAITVASPAIGAMVTSPVTVSGTADVFEAVVSIEILNSAGQEIARTFTTASCGTGCRGSYTTTISYSVPATQKGTLEVFERSAKDGSPVNMQKIPVTLGP